jgi:hypothetical protein
MILLLLPLLVLGACTSPVTITSSPATNVAEYFNNIIIDTDITLAPLMDQARGKLGFT